MKFLSRFLTLLLALLLVPAAANADEPTLAQGQTLYLPIYSHVWHGDLKEGGYPLKSLVSALVSIRNTDPKVPIRVLSARYFDTGGKQLHEYIGAAKIVPPMGTYELYVERKETAGGSGANFLIAWEADSPANLPVVEAVHADIQGHRTLSFITGARAIRMNR
ncbi:MAG: DUF3124 domain-containing protein [Sulfuricellaceae bacterium]